MGRETCSMCHHLGTDTYCDFYDVFFMKCEDIKTCPDGLDEDDYDDEEGIYDDDYQEYLEQKAAKTQV